MLLQVVAFLDESHPCQGGNGTHDSCVYPCAGFKESPDGTEPISIVGIYLAAEKYGGKVFDHKVSASEDLLAAVAEFCNNHDGKETGLDCYGFVNLIGKRPPHKYRDIALYWQDESVAFQDIRAGNIICFGNSRGFFAHAAICIEDDVCLSVYGMNCDLQFSSFQQMQKQYDLTEAMKLTPKR